MGAISFPLSSDSSSGPNRESPQEVTKLTAEKSGPSSVAQADVVTLSAVFPPARPVDAPSFVSIQLRSPAQSAIQGFPPAQTPAADLQAPSAAATNAPSQATLTQEEQLARLNLALQQLGISPQSISLDNRLALIPSANDPPALLNLVRTLGVLSDTAGSAAQVAPVGANSLSNPSPAESQTPAPIQAAPAQNSTAQAGAGFEAAAVSGTAQSTPSASPAVAPGNNPSAQFQELQLALQSIEIPQSPSGDSTDAGASFDQTPSLNVRA